MKVTNVLHTLMKCYKKLTVYIAAMHVAVLTITELQTRRRPLWRNWAETELHREHLRHNRRRTKLFESHISQLVACCCRLDSLHWWISFIIITNYCSALCITSASKINHSTKNHHHHLLKNLNNFLDCSSWSLWCDIIVCMHFLATTFSFFLCCQLVLRTSSA